MTTAAVSPKKNKTMRKEQYLTYLLMTFPGFVLYCVFLILPILMGIRYSLTDWTGIGTEFNEVGLDNYVKVLTNDRRFGQAMIFNFRYTIMLVAGIVVIGFILALLLNRELKGRGFFRTLYFLPAVLSMVTVGLVFKQVYFYVLPVIGQSLGISALATNVISRKETAIYGIVFVNLWQGLAMPTLLFLAGLQTIPQELHEAAAIDGANAWQRFKAVTVPYMMPTLSVVLVLTVKGGLGVYDYINVMTGGSYNTTSIAYLIYQNAFERNRFSYSIAQAVIVGLIIAAISFVQIRLTNAKKVE